jgi:hypothetical protein
VIIPRVPLEQNSTYVVALRDGIKTVNGGSFQPSGTWRLIRGQSNPVTIEGGLVISDQTPLDPANPEDRATLQGIDLLWKVHAQGLKFIADDLPADKRVARDQILIAWEFKTQTSIDPLDPTVAGSPAAKVATTPLLGNGSLAAGLNRTTQPYIQCTTAGELNDVQCYLKIALGKGNYTTGNAICGQVGCAAIGDVIGSGLVAKQYQVDTPNAYTGTGAKPIPGPWSDSKSPTEVKDEQISALSWIPATAAPAAGYPVVIFQHGLGQGKTNAFAIAGSLAAAGFATIAIDAVAHDSRAVRISNNPAARRRSTSRSATRRSCRRTSARRATRSARPRSISSGSSRRSRRAAPRRAARSRSTRPRSSTSASRSAGSSAASRSGSRRTSRPPRSTSPASAGWTSSRTPRRCGSSASSSTA